MVVHRNIEVFVCDARYITRYNIGIFGLFGLECGDEASLARARLKTQERVKTKECASESQGVVIVT